MPPPRPRRRFELQKVFLLDPQGGYTGEMVLVEDCVVEYSDFLAAVPEVGLGDGQSVFLGEYMATLLQGERMGLVAVYKGTAEPESIAWGRAALTAAEAQLSPAGEAPAVPTGPDKGVLENLAKALERREAQIAEREAALQAKETAMGADLAQRGRAVQGELEALRKRLADSEAERTRLREQMGRMTAPPPGTDVAGQLEKDRKMLQRRALELLDREEKVRAREQEAVVATENMTGVLRENDDLRARLEAMEKAAGPLPFDAAAAKREMDMRVKILQQKALDLLDREEKLRKKEEVLRQRGIA